MLTLGKAARGYAGAKKDFHDKKAYPFHFFTVGTGMPFLYSVINYNARRTRRLRVHTSIAAENNTIQRNTA